MMSPSQQHPLMGSASPSEFLAPEVAAYLVGCSRFELCPLELSLAVFLPEPSSVRSQTYRLSLPRTFAPLQSLSRDSTFADGASKTAAFIALLVYVLPLGNTLTNRQSPLLGSLSLFATSTGRVHFSRDFPFPGTFRPQTFSASRRFAPPAASRPCFMRAATCRVFPFRGFPFQTACTRLVAWPFPHAVTLSPASCALDRNLGLNLR